MESSISRRALLKSGALLASGLLSRVSLWGGDTGPKRLEEFGYQDVTVSGARHQLQLDETLSVILGLNEDGLLKPFRETAGLAAPGVDLGGWYNYTPDYDRVGGDVGFATGGTFGQWVSALARYAAIKGSSEARNKVFRLNRLYAAAVSGGFFEKNRFPAYCYDKLVCGLIDSHQFVQDPEAWEILGKTTQAALPHLPPHAIERNVNWRPGKGAIYGWDESYTMPENLFIAYTRGAGEQYRELAVRYLDDQPYFDPLARGENVLGGRHAYSYVNALNSAMQAYLVLGSQKHLQAAQNGFAMLTAQSFATGGWGPDEQLVHPGSDTLFESLSKTHSGFETPCGAYAHFKLTRYLLRVTRDSRYGDSMERVMYNTVLGAKVLEDDGHAFYYSDYNFKGRRAYSSHIWPCCSGTLSQDATDYGIGTYFHDSYALWVNLYVPSTVRWKLQGAQVEVTQLSEYPIEEKIRFRVKTTQPAEFAIHLRIPAWAQNASIVVNGKSPGVRVEAAKFTEVRRTWRDGDQIELTLPMDMRLEPLDDRHPEIMALLRGPLVLFPVQDGPLSLPRKQALAATRIAEQTWQIETSAGPVKLSPFVAIGNLPYSTYIEMRS